MTQQWFYFTIKYKDLADAALQELKHAEIQEISLIEEVDSGKTFFCGRLGEKPLPTSWRFIECCTPISESIDWNEQWEKFCPYFHEGRCDVPLADFFPGAKKTLHLAPGAGFGDLSHPTTRLMMRQIATHVSGQTVIDLGCGSGILGLSALLFGAQKAYCLDIDPEAISHTKINGKLNSLDENLFVGAALPSDLPFCPEILLLNMTLAEQKEALKSLLVIPPLWITSGILKHQKSTYLTFMKQYDLTLKSMQMEEEWLSFIFKKDAK